MVKPKVMIGDVRRTSPVWLGTRFFETHIAIPGGIGVDTTGMTPDDKGKIMLPSGTVLGQTFAEYQNGDLLGLAADGDQFITILIHDLKNALEDPYGAGLRPASGNSVYYNFLPDWDTLAAAVQNLVFQNFNCVRGRL